MSNVNVSIVIKNVRLSFPHIWEPVKFNEDSKPRWSASFIVQKGSETDKQIEEAINKSALEAFNNDHKKAELFLKQIRGQKIQWCYMDGDLKSYDGAEGNMILSCHRAYETSVGFNKPPLIIDRNKEALNRMAPHPVAGDYVNSKVEIYTQVKDNPGMRASFSVIQFSKIGEPFGSATPSDEGMEVENENEDEYDDNIPL